jgi:hypothetical protein
VKYPKPVFHDVTASPVNLQMSTSMWLPVVRVWKRMQGQANAIYLHADGSAYQVRDLVAQHVYKLRPTKEWSQADVMCVKETEDALNRALVCVKQQDALPDLLPCLLAEPLVREVLKQACQEPEVHPSTRSALVKARALLGENAIDLLAGLAE